MKSSHKKTIGPTEGEPLSREDALSLVPVKNAEAVVARLDSGDMVLEYPSTVRPFIAGILRRFGGKEAPVHLKKIQLDALGTAAWDLIDGERTVGSLVTRFADKFQLHPKEAELAVTQFLRELGKRGLIGLR